MNIVIVGQGAIGLLWYHKLSLNPEHQISLQCSARSQPIPENLSFTDTHGKVQTKIVSANNKDLSNADIILFCLKAYSYQQAFNQYLPFIQQETPVILCHNGILAENEIPKDHLLLSLLTTHGSKRIKAFSVEHTGIGVNDLGIIQGKISNSQIELLTDVLNQALPETVWHEDINAKQWRKLAVNCVINPLTAINNCDNGVLTSAAFQPKIKAILLEVIAVAKHFKLNFDINELTSLVLSVAQQTATNCSSMRSDILNGRKTEIAQINGFIVQQGANLNIATPINSELTHAVNALAKDNKRDSSI
ncbi:2-dehydropantoate 2-reductase [Thalassotalea insulae]|uniref:2-dehydropantoate 2-reductase n=1 Tax=Thalassotalea insulae TaxID=2056778 RepID=A0ABQ6GTL3_9GAMM|nr:2-dehydropantoate 2-reductase [Thalassotalea insulae]GLX79273.1 2-dehydropantoate 2-reductase [Thalassotalea insulae]